MWALRKVIVQNFSVKFKVEYCEFCCSMWQWGFAIAYLLFSVIGTHLKIITLQTFSCISHQNHWFYVLISVYDWVKFEYSGSESRAESSYFCGHCAEPNAHFWIAMIPLVVVLIIGMKLQHVIATLALEHSGVKSPFVGVLLKPRDQLFWFNRPKFLLHVIHFIFFEVLHKFVVHNLTLIVALHEILSTSAKSVELTMC